jgi:hypothetical protein
MPNKVRVVVSMPVIGPSLLLRLSRLIAYFVILGGIGQFECKPTEAVPMAGTCVDVTLKHYSKGDKDAKRCTWEGEIYWCVLDPVKAEWSCDFIEHAPLEKK